METSQINLLVADDDKEIAELAAIYLKEDGYQVFTAFSGRSALEELKKHDIHLAILDIMMPGMDGFEVCSHIRRTSNIPILMLSALGSEDNKVEGLSCGADDYIVKPFSPAELKARVKSHLRRFMILNSAPETAAGQKSPDEESSRLLHIKQLIINIDTHEVTSYDRAISLTPTEFKILFFLASHAGQVFSTDEIFEAVWGEKFYEANNTVMVHIRRIREKIELDPRNAQILKTVWGVGYKVEA